MDESRDSESLEYFDRALDAFELISRETSYVHSYRGIVRMHVNDLDGALEDLTSAINSQNLEAIERVRARLVRAQALILKNRQEEALEDLDHVIDSSEGGHLKVSALRIRGGIRVEQGMLDEALVDFDAVLSLEDASPEEVATVLCARGDLKCERGEREAAIADYSRALTLEVLSGAEQAEVLWNRASLFGDVGCLAEARADYEMMARLDGVPDGYKADALGNLGWLLLTMGDFVGSRISSEAAVALDSKGAGPWFNLGLANLLLGDQEKARIAYEQGCELGSPDELREALKDLEDAGEDHGHPAGADEIGGLLRLRSTDPGPRTKAVDQPSLPGSS